MVGKHDKARKDGTNKTTCVFTDLGRGLDSMDDIVPVTGSSKCWQCSSFVELFKYGNYNSQPLSHSIDIFSDTFFNKVGNLFDGTLKVL